MPSSPIETVPYLIEFIRKNKPDLHTVLDVGIGFGKDAFLLREYFDVKRDRAHTPKDWKLDITGVDIYDGYISELQKILYNKIIIDDIFTTLPTLQTFDLAVLAEVIEHFPKENGQALLKELFKHVEDIVITTPNGFYEHPAKEEDAHEEHLSGWTLDDFKDFTIIDSALVKSINKPTESLVLYLRK